MHLCSEPVGKKKHRRPVGHSFDKGRETRQGRKVNREKWPAGLKWTIASAKAVQASAEGECPF